MAIIFNGVEQTPYFNGPVGEVWANEIKRWPSGWICDPSVASIAVSHTVLEGGDTGQKIWLGVIDNGYGIVVSSPTTDVIDPVTLVETHSWKRSWVSEAEEISVAFVSAIQNGSGDYKEYVTEGKPWVFWIHDGALYGQKIGTESAVSFANEGCLSVSAINGFKLSGSSFFDYGLCVFFILSGHLYYRQLIGGTWYDAIEVTMAPTGVLWKQVAAGRTWDYRLVIQLLGDDGNLYELYTRHGGFGKAYTEHLEITGASETHSLLQIFYNTAKSPDEHMEIAGAAIITPYGGSYQIGDAQIVKAWNIATEVEDDETHEITEDWGLRVCVKFDREITQADAVTQIAQFGMLDSQNHAFYPSTTEADRTGRVFTFTFSNFNNARGDLTFSYIPGTVGTMAGYTLLESDAVFTPKNLVPISLPAPVPIAIWNE